MEVSESFFWLDYDGSFLGLEINLKWERHKTCYHFSFQDKSSVKSDVKLGALRLSGISVHQSIICPGRIVWINDWRVCCFYLVYIRLVS